MVFSYLTEENIFDKYKEAKKYTEKLTDTFNENERIALNKPQPDIDERYPDVTDGTTASIIRKSARRVLQQIPTGVVISDDDDWHGPVAGFILREKIIPYANDGYSLLQKGWNVIENALTFGSCTTYTPFLDHDGYLSPGLTIPYWGDVIIPKGYISIKDAPYFFLRSWWNKENIEALLDSQKKLDKKTEKTWDVQGLQEIKDLPTSKDQQAQTPTDRDKLTSSTSGIELVTGFQKGVDGTFITFAPTPKIIVRRKKNKDPRGKIPRQTMYGDVDGINPFGRSVISLIGPLQNLIDADMQMYQFNRALMLAPPIKKKGNFSSSKIQYIPNAVIDMGADPNADAIPLTIDTTAIANYPALYGLQKSQLLNLVSSPDTSISADVGNPGFSKTPEGLKQQKAAISVDDNYLRKMYEDWFEEWCEDAINIWFAERQGIEELELDDDTLDELQNLAMEGKFDMSMVNGNTIRIDYSKETPLLKFRVDASTSKMEDDASKVQSLTALLQTLESVPALQQIITAQYPDKLIEAWNKIVEASSVEDPEDMKIDLEDFKAKQQQMQSQAQASQAQQPKPPSMSVNYKDAPEDIKRQMEMADGFQPSQMTSPVQQQVDNQTLAKQQPNGPQDQQQSALDDQLRQALAGHGLDQNAIEQAVAMANQGYSDQQIMQMLGVQ